MHRLAKTCALVICFVANAVAQKPPGLISCTGAVPRDLCDAVTAELDWRQQLPAVHTVQFVIADAKSFDGERATSGDYVLAGVLNKTNPRSLTPAIHSSFDEDIIFELTNDAPLKCPDRVVISADLFQGPKKGGTNASSMNFNLVSLYVTFIHGYLEGCLGARQAR
jgi:hypothetical protein